MFERFDGDARRTVVLAQEHARMLGHTYIGTEHVLLGVVHLPTELPVRRALRQLGLTQDGAVTAVEEIIGRDRASLGAGHIPFTPRAKTVLELALREALQLGSNEVRPEHILLAILREGEGVAAQILMRGDRSLADLRATVLTSTQEPVSQEPVAQNPVSQEPVDHVSATHGSVTQELVAPAPGSRTPAVDEVLALAERLAAGAPMGTHHMLEALTRLDASAAGRVLAELGVTVEAVTAQVDALDLATTSDATPEHTAAATDAR